MKSFKSIYTILGGLLLIFPVVFLFQNCSKPNFTPEQNGAVVVSNNQGAVICTNSAMDPADCVPANEAMTCSFTVSPAHGSEAPSYFITLQNYEVTKERYYEYDINGGGPGGRECRAANLVCENGQLYFGEEKFNRNEVFSGCAELQL